MAPPPPSLPSDCLLHVFLRLDPVSILRCASVSRHWRRAVIDNASEIRRHPWRRADRYLLLGFYHREMYPGELGFSHRSSWSPTAGRHWSDDVPVPSYMPVVEGTKMKFYAPLACNDGLLLLCRGLPPEICVCNPLTGFHASMPRFDQLATYRYFLHSCHGVEMDSSPNSFQVLAVGIDRDGILALQNYSSESRTWGPVFRPKINELRMPKCEYRAAPVMCRGAINWLCSKVSDYPPGERYYFGQITHIVAVDLTTGQARMTRLPQQCTMRNDDVSTSKMLMLATSEGDQLSLLRSEVASLEVSIWLYTGDHGAQDDGEESWVLSRSVNIRKLIEDAGLAHFRLGCKDWAVLEIRLLWFCPRSCRVIIWIPYLGLFVLDLESMRIQRATGDSHGHIWPYEIDLTFCFSSIKPY